jgi:hypothetical protein
MRGVAVLLLLGSNACRSEAVDPVDAAFADTILDMVAIDGPQEALNCHLPGPKPGEIISSLTGSTAGRANNVSAMCGGQLHDGPDAVYLMSLGAMSRLNIDVTGNFPVTAYFLDSSSCTSPPATPPCEVGVYATPGSPLSVGPFSSGSIHFVVVDALDATQSGPYQLAISFN